MTEQDHFKYSPQKRIKKKQTKKLKIKEKNKQRL